MPSFVKGCRLFHPLFMCFVSGLQRAVHEIFACRCENLFLNRGRYSVTKVEVLETHDAQVNKT